MRGLWHVAGLALGFAGLVGACTDRSPREEHDAAVAESVSPPSSERDSLRAARARQAANELGRELQTKLFAALDSGGPSRAITFCADSAQAWTARHATEGVYVRRVSLRVRNPANRPDAVERVELVRLDSLHRTGALPGEILRHRPADGAGIVEYMRPIVIQDRCLTCHGPREQIAPDVRRLIAARYPADSATGYRTGDLRGMISVRVRE